MLEIISEMKVLSQMTTVCKLSVQFIINNTNYTNPY